MTPGPDVERLKALAFGRASTPAEEQAAADARLALQQMARVDVDPVDAPEPARPDVTPMANEEPEPAASAVPSRHRWIVAAAGMVACLAVGYGVATVTQPTAAEPVQQIVVSPDSAELIELPRPGDIQLAERLFEREQVEADLVAQALTIESMDLDPATVHALAALDDLRVFAARSNTGDYCLIIEDRPSGASGGGCTKPERFEQSALRIGSNAVQASWDGKELLLSTPTR